MEIGSSNRTQLLAGAVALCALLGCSKTYETHAVSWHHGAEAFPTAVVEQEKSGKPLLIFFYRSKCHACRFVDDAILSDLEVERAISDLVRVRLNPEDDPETAQLVSRFEVSIFPTIMLANSSEGERYRFRTSQLDPVATFLEDLLVGLVTLDVRAPRTSLSLPSAQSTAALR